MTELKSSIVLDILVYGYEVLRSLVFLVGVFCLYFRQFYCDVLGILSLRPIFLYRIGMKVYINATSKILCHTVFKSSMLMKFYIARKRSNAHPCIGYI